MLGRDRQGSLYSGDNAQSLHYSIYTNFPSGSISIICPTGGLNLLVQKHMYMYLSLDPFTVHLPGSKDT